MPIPHTLTATLPGGIITTAVALIVDPNLWTPGRDSTRFGIAAAGLFWIVQIRGATIYAGSAETPAACVDLEPAAVDWASLSAKQREDLDQAAWFRLCVDCGRDRVFLAGGGVLLSHPVAE